MLHNLCEDNVNDVLGMLWHLHFHENHYDRVCANTTMEYFVEATINRDAYWLWVNTRMQEAADSLRMARYANIDNRRHLQGKEMVKYVQLLVDMALSEEELELELGPYNFHLVIEPGSFRMLEPNLYVGIENMHMLHLARFLHSAVCAWKRDYPDGHYEVGIDEEDKALIFKVHMVNRSTCIISSLM